MKRIEKTILCGTGYTVLILTIFYAFAAIADLESTSISIGRFFLILGFGMLIAAAELIYDLLSVRKLIKNIIHYFLLLISFSIIFIFGDFYSSKGITAVFVSIILFTVLYFIMLGIVIGVRRTVCYTDKKLDSKLARSADKSTASKETKYTPKFK